MSLLFKVAEEVRTLKEQTDKMKHTRKEYEEKRDSFLALWSQEDRKLAFEFGTEENTKFREATNETFERFDRAKRDRKNTLNRLNTLASKLD